MKLGKDHMPFVYDDGGRKDAGRKGLTGDCVCRAVAIASGKPYAEVYTALASGTESQRGRKKGCTASHGINTTRKWFKDYMRGLGFKWVPCMAIGTGCKTHLVAGELPMGRLVVAVSRHYCAVIDGILRDTHDPQRRTFWYEDGQIARVSERCVYGYWIQEAK